MGTGLLGPTKLSKPRETETLHKAGSRNLKPMPCIETFYLCQSGLSNIHIIARLVGSMILMPFKRKDRNRIDDSRETLEALETETLHKAGSRNLKPMRCIETFYFCQTHGKSQDLCQTRSHWTRRSKTCCSLKELLKSPPKVESVCKTLEPSEPSETTMLRVCVRLSNPPNIRDHHVESVCKTLEPSEHQRPSC